MPFLSNLPKAAKVDICAACRYFDRYYIRERGTGAYLPLVFGRCLCKRRPRLHRRDICPFWPHGNL